MYDPYKWNGVKPFFINFKSGGLNAQHDLKADGSIAHKAKFKGPGFNAGDRWECITTNKDHEQKYWYALPQFQSSDGAVKVQAKVTAKGDQSGAVALMAGGYKLGDFQVYSHAQLELVRKAAAEGKERKVDWSFNWQENFRQNENNFGWNLWFSEKKDGQKVPFLESADVQAAHLADDKILWARVRPLKGSDFLLGGQFKHDFGKTAMELGYSWDKDSKVHGLTTGVPLHLRLGTNCKLADGIVWDSVQSLGKEYKSRDKVDFQVTKSTKVSLAFESDLKKTFSAPSSMLK